MIGTAVTPCATHLNLGSPLSESEESIMAELKRSNRQSEADLLNKLGTPQGNLRGALESLRKRGLIYKRPAEWSEDGIIRYALGVEIHMARYRSIAKYKACKEANQYGYKPWAITAKQQVKSVINAFEYDKVMYSVWYPDGQWLTITEISWASGCTEEDVVAGIEALLSERYIMERTSDSMKQYAWNPKQGLAVQQ